MGVQGEFFRSLFDILHKKRSQIGRDSVDRAIPTGGHAQFRRRFSISSRAAGTNLTKPARYAGEYLDPLQIGSGCI